MPEHDLSLHSSPVLGRSPSKVLERVRLRDLSPTSVWVHFTSIVPTASASSRQMDWRRRSVSVDVSSSYSSAELPLTATTSHLIIGASVLLLASSVPRIRKGPMPLMLTAASLGAGSYYARTTYRVRQHRMSEKNFWMTPSYISKPHEI